jgi:FkbM family methyltransferase
MDLRSESGRLRRALTDSAARERWKRRRLWDVLPRYLPAVTTYDRFGNAVTVSTGDQCVSYYVFVNRTFEPANVDAISSVLTERGFVPEQVVDVGANIGSSTLELLSIFPGCKAVCIEPDSGNFRLLRQNVVLNGLDDRVEVINSAVGAHTGTVTMALSSNNHGDHRIARLPTDGIEVPIQPLRDLIETSPPTLFWIDVQGYEGHVFDGAPPGLFDWPVVVEFTPDLLRETDGFDSFMRAVERFPTVLEVAGESPRPLVDLEARAEQLAQDGANAAIDLILLPW